MKSFIAAFDLHFGWEYRYRRGNRYIAPTHSLESVAAMMEFARDLRPDVFILGGDQLNCGPVSHWLRGKPRKLENLRLKEEMDMLEKHILLPVEKMTPKEKVWLRGNHEVWIEELVNEIPGIEGLVEPENYLRLKQRGWKVFAQGEIYKLGKLNIIHGDVLPPGKNVAEKMVKSYRRNVRCGDRHRYEAATDDTPYDSKDIHTGIVVPAMSQCNAAYMKNRVSNHHQGFLFGWVAPNGNFTDHVMTIINNKFIHNGKVYDGRSKGK